MSSEDEEARAFLIARELIAEHGDWVGDFLQTRIDELARSGELEEFAKWFIIRNAVAITLGNETTLH